MFYKSSGVALTFDAPGADVASDYEYALNYFPVQYGPEELKKVVSSSMARSALVRQVASITE